VIRRQRLRVGDVQAGTADAPVRECGDQLVRDDTGAAADVDEQRAALRGIEKGLVEDVFRLRRQRERVDDDVRARGK
jgi:hypothetical protein